MLGAVSEYHRRTAAERSAEAQVRAVARGVLPYPNIPPGYVRGDDGVLVPDPSTSAVVAEAFRLRDSGATVAGVRAFLRERGIVRSYHGVMSMLGSRVYLGEIHFGDLHNTTAHPAIVDPDVWRRVQGRSSPRGRKAKSERLLARLGVLRCATCDSRMVVGTSNNSSYYLYRCPPTGDCPRRVTISAALAEEVVVNAVREHLADAEGRASADASARQAITDRDQAQADLDAAIRAFAGVADEPAATERLGELRARRDAAESRVDRLRGAPDALTVNAAADWDRLSLEARRALIRTTVQRATVTPGRGADRVNVELLGA
jgi:hypothetical protein